MLATDLTGFSQPDSYNDAVVRDLTEESGELDEFSRDLHAHIEKDRERWDKMVDNQRAIEIAVLKLTAQVEQLTKATEGVVEAWQTANALQRFLKWLGGFAIIGGLITWVLSHFGGNPPT